MRFHSPPIALCCLFIIHILSFINGNAQTPLVVHGTPNWTQGRDIGPYVQFYEDKARKPLLLNQIQALQTFRPYAQKRDEHRTDSDVTLIITWLKFQIHNTHPTDTLKLLLSGRHAVLESYIQEHTEPTLEYKTGLTVVATLPYWAKHGDHCTVPIVVPPQKKRLFLIKGSDFLIDWPYDLLLLSDVQYSVFKAQRLVEWNNHNVFMALVTAIALLLALTGLFQWIQYRKSVYGYWALYLFCVAGYYLRSYEFHSYTKIVSQLYPRFFLFATPICTNGAMISYTLFLNKFLNLSVLNPKFYILTHYFRAFWALIIAISVTSILYSLSFPKSTVIVTSIVGYTLLGAVVINLFLVRYPLGYLLRIGVICLVVGIVASYAYTNMPFFVGFQSVKITSSFLAGWGILLEFLFFQIALSEQRRQSENRMQTRYAEQLERQLEYRTKEIQAQSQMLERQHIRQLESDFEQRIAETEMTALRAQMNPHFIFNCLNSIKLYTLENDALAASEYLTKFSRLIRLVLENSRSEKVTLENELETLELYIEMEAMRFKNKVRYGIKIDEDIDPQYVEIPPLLLQPYVENAIWHGLMHREEGGTVQIAVQTLHRTSGVDSDWQSTLQVTITDDGIGRATAAELKSKSATKNKSFGLKMTSERIEIINQLYKTNTNVKIEDLYDSKGQAAGTKVLILIPI